MRKVFTKYPATSARRYIRAAEFDEGIEEDTDGLEDNIDDVADDVEDLQDAVSDVEEDNDSIAVNNNISEHYIAECDSCKGVFISAVIASDQEVDSISGVCPLCGKETEQYLKWVIKPASDKDELE